MGWRRLNVKKAAGSENRNVPTFRNIPMSHRGKPESLKGPDPREEECVQRCGEEP